jgi:5-methylcytosine-specific restriction protein A
VIRGTIAQSTHLGISLNVIKELADDTEAVEGGIITVLHKKRERSGGLPKKRKLMALRKTGTLACEVCTFDFAARYGERGRDYIECHHTKPVETLGDGKPTRLSDLALVCANCRRMIHSGRPWLTIEELKACLRPH